MKFLTTHLKIGKSQKWSYLIISIALLLCCYACNPLYYITWPYTYQDWLDAEDD